jgi:hypothetical protein
VRAGANPADDVTAEELCALAGVPSSFLAELESYGIAVGRAAGAQRWFEADTVDVVVAAAGLCSLGLEARHLRAYRSNADRELNLVEQLVGPRLRQRNARAHEDALDMAARVEELAGLMRAAFIRAGLRHLSR